MGLAFAFGWTPCIGPILAAILAVAGAEETVARGALLLAAYAFGLGVPFVLAAMAMEQFLGLRARLSRPIRPARESGRRAAGADRRGVPDRRLSERLGVADRDFPARSASLGGEAVGRRRKRARRSRGGLRCFDGEPEAGPRDLDHS